MFSIDLVYTKRNTFTLECFLQFACTNLDGSQEEGGNFLNLLQKEGVRRKRGFLQKRGEVPIWRKLCSEQLLFSPFSEQSLFPRSYFFRKASFLEWKFYRISTSWEQEVLYGRYFLEQLFFLEELLRIKLYKKSYFFKAGTSAQHQPSQKSYVLEKTDFSENQFTHYLLFLENCLFRATTFSKDATFYRSYPLRRATFLQHAFSEELQFHSYGSFPQLTLLIYSLVIM